MLGVPGMLRGSTKLVGLAHCELLKGRVAVSHSYVARSRTGPRVHWARCWETNIPGDFVVPDIPLPFSPRPAATPPWQIPAGPALLPSAQHFSSFLPGAQAATP